MLGLFFLFTFVTNQIISTMETIYRYEIQNEELNNPGPYHGGNAFSGNKVGEYYELSHNMNRSHTRSRPNLFFDFEEGITHEDHYCACVSLNSLKTWFKGYNTKLKRMGFNIVEYKVRYIIIGNSGNQCVFEHKNVISKKIITN